MLVDEYRVAVWILDLYLTSAGTGFHLVPEAKPGALECSDEAREIRRANAGPIIRSCRGWAGGSTLTIPPLT